MSTDASERVVSRVVGVPPVARWYQLKKRCMKPTLTMPMVQAKFWVQAWTSGGSGTAVMPIMA